jgi:hypothetical protein
MRPFMNPNVSVSQKSFQGVCLVRDWKNRSSFASENPATRRAARFMVIYFTRNEAEELVLLTSYAKSKTNNLRGAVLKEIRRALEP